MEFLHCCVINVFTTRCWYNSGVVVFTVMTVRATAKPISHLLFFLLDLPKGHEIFLCADSKNGDPEIGEQKARAWIDCLESSNAITRSVYN